MNDTELHNILSPHENIQSDLQTVMTQTFPLVLSALSKDKEHLSEQRIIQSSLQLALSTSQSKAL